jgi:hypothetical protein
MKEMNSKQIFMMIAIIATLGAAMIATPVMAQNMTGGNVTGPNMTAGAGGPAAEGGESEDEEGEGEGDNEEEQEGGN